MYTQIELPTTAFHAADANQNIEEMFNYFHSISDQNPNGYIANKIGSRAPKPSDQTDNSSQNQLIIEHNPLALLITALRAGDDRFYKLARFLLDDSFLYEADSKPLKEEATTNYPLWCQIKWGWAVASAIKVIMQDVKHMLLDTDCKLHLLPQQQTKYDYKNCFVLFSDTDELYYINDERTLFARDKTLIKLDQLEAINPLKKTNPSVFKLPKDVVSSLLGDDTPDDFRNFSLLRKLDDDSIEMYHIALLNRLTELKPALDDNFNYLMDQVLSTKDKDSRQQLYAKFLEQIRRYMPESVEEIAQSIFNVNGQNSTQALLEKIDTLIASSSKAEDGANITYEIQTTPYQEGIQNLSNRKKEDRTHMARLLMQDRLNGVAGHEIPSQYRPLTEHQRTMLEQSPNQKTTAGIPTSYTPLTEGQLIALGGSVAHDAIDPKTGSPLYLLALLYGNTEVCSFLKLRGAVLLLETKNLKGLTATIYEQADLSTIYQYTTPSALVAAAREKVMTLDAEGELLRKFDKQLRTYQEEWIIRQAKITKRELSDNFSDKAYDALINLFQLKRSFTCRGIEVEFYIQLVEDALDDPFTSELYNKALKALKTSPNQSLILNTELPSQVKSILKEIKSNEEQYTELQPVSSIIVERYKANQALANQHNPSEFAKIQGEVIQLKQDKIDMEKALREAEERSATKITAAITEVQQKNAIDRAEVVNALETRHAIEIEFLETSNKKLSTKVDKIEALLERLLSQSSSTNSELLTFNETKSNSSGRGSPDFFG